MFFLLSRRRRERKKKKKNEKIRKKSRRGPRQRISNEPSIIEIYSPGAGFVWENVRINKLGTKKRREKEKKNRKKKKLIITSARVPSLHLP